MGGIGVDKMRKKRVGNMNEKNVLKISKKNGGKTWRETSRKD